MRFLLTSHHAPPHIGGVENLVLAEAIALLEAGHDVTWITSDGTGAGQQPPDHPRLRIERIPAWHWPERAFHIAFPLYAPSLLWRTWRAVGAADVVHAHGLVFLASPVACLFARLRGKWSLCTDHAGLLRYRFWPGTLFLRVLFSTIGRLTARCANRLIAYNGDIELLMRNLCGDDSKVQFVPNPVDPTRFCPPAPGEREAARRALGWDERPRVLCVGRLLPHKGIDVLLAAQEPGWRLVFCGPGEESMREHIRAGGAECLAPRPQGELRQLYHAADAFALPSYNEGFPVVVQEALACGLPVLTSDAPAYAPYRGTPGLHLCAPEAKVVQQRLRELLAVPRPSLASSPIAVAPSAWVQSLMPPVVLPARATAVPGWMVLAMVLLAVHLLLGIVRLPGKVWARRLDDVAAYREQGAVSYLFRGAKLEGAEIVQWLQREVPPDAAVLWRWPCDGALEFPPALLAPRLFVDERAVPPGAVTAAGRPLARGVLPDGSSGVLVLQGTADGAGLVLRVREP
ncbi:MAG: glycosyltransferase family 4 protein [Planctomycetes bacterium]|jgi:glycosyltransferase involved in cell wall biosynthesis|nr:glycosyltransferase family 4 protein [Planctomycetota bacterium]